MSLYSLYGYGFGREIGVLREACVFSTCEFRAIVIYWQVVQHYYAKLT